VKTLSSPSAAKRALVSLALAAALLMPAFALALADDDKVTIDNFAFAPNVITVKPGTTVTFVNHDDIPHSVVDSAGKFHSKALDTNDSFQVTFDQPGEYNYYCGLHSHMRGKVIVAP
jgi:plastocyanin